MDEEVNFTVEIEGREGKVCNVKIENCDLSAIVNGYPDDPFELWPFDKIFTRAIIWKWWCKVGFFR